MDFRYFQLVNIYEDTNAFHPNSEWKREAVRPWQRGVDNQVLMTQKDATHLEQVLGTRGRSGEQMDIFLEEATYLLQQFLGSTKDPYYAGTFDIGRRQPHCYSGMPEFPGQTAYQRVLPQMLDRILKTAPSGADLKSWRY